MLKTKDIMLLKAKDVMTENVISVRKETPIREAVVLLVKHNITGIPVVEDDMTLVGILSEKDVLTLIYGQEGEVDKTVSDFMTTPPVYFDQDESVVDVCDCLTNNFFRRVPVTEKGKLVGIISRRDMIYEYIVRRGQESAGTGSMVVTLGS